MRSRPFRVTGATPASLDLPLNSWQTWVALRPRFCFSGRFTLIVPARRILEAASRHLRHPARNLCSRAEFSAYRMSGGSISTGAQGAAAR
jgi:hypothetical protein